MAERRAPLCLRITLDGLGRRPPNALLFEPGSRVGIHTIVRQTGTWIGDARWILCCPSGHEFTRTTGDIRRSASGQRAPIRCRECGR
jgi:hypothetical protein